MILRFLAAFPPASENPCVSTYIDTLFHIYDPAPPAEATAPDEARKHLPCQRRTGEAQVEDLRVENATGAVIHLIAVDNCLYTSGDPKRCDGALLRDEDIRFVEFSHGNYRRRSERVEKCIPQLAATINQFHAVGIIPAKTTVQAIICVGFTEEFPPRNAQLSVRSVQINALVEADIIVELQVTDTTTF